MFAAVSIPCFSIQALVRHEPELAGCPLALVDPERPKENIIETNRAAEKLGVVAGLTPAQALARSPGLLIRSRSRSREQVATEILLQNAFAFSPGIESTGAGLCLLDLKGLKLETEAALENWAGQILQALESFHLSGRIGIAQTPGLALLAAQMAGRVNLVQDIDAFVAQLPISRLKPAPEISEILARWGIHLVGELLTLGKAEVAARLGREVLELFESVSPDGSRPLKLVSPPSIFSEQMDFESEIETIEPLLFVLQRFVEQLSQRIATLHLVVGELHLRLSLASGQNHEHTFRIPDPTHSAPVLFRMLHTHLEGVRTGSPIVSLCVIARPCVANLHQFGLFETTLSNPNQFGETLARLNALCGPERVGTPIVEPTHRPDAFRMSTPDFSTAMPVPEAQKSFAGFALRRFRPAVPATIEFRGSQPALIRSRVLNGIAAEVRGPFCSSGDWWDEHRWTREEWDIQTAEGTLCRIYRSPAGCFVEGVYD
jgi:protein ImuB